MKKQGSRSKSVQPRPELDLIKKAIAGDAFWETYLAPLSEECFAFSVHLAIFVEPFLGYVLDGSKTVESRFSVKRCAPFGKVRQGDVLLLKRTGGPVVGLTHVRSVWSYHLDPSSWREIREEFAKALRAEDPEFWRNRRKASYATLMLIDHVRSIDPIAWKKADRRAWVVVQNAAQPLLL